MIATGGQTGAYYQFAQKYAEELKTEGVTLEVRETNGAVENLRLLEDDASGVSVAIVQSGVAGPEDRENCKPWAASTGSLCGFSTVAMHNLRPPQPTRGQAASASAPKAAAPTRWPCAARRQRPSRSRGRAAKPDKKTTLIQEKVADAADALRKGDLDAAFFVAAFRTDSIQQLLKDDGVRLG